MAKEKKAPITVQNSGGSFEKVEKWIIKNDRLFLNLLIVLTVLLTFISFNSRISEAHDDALYLEGGWRFVNEFPNYFYTQNAPLYPMVLAILIKIFGFKLIIFKLFSSLFNLAGLVFFYKALKGRLPALVFIPVMLFQACNYLIIYYASMTFTESFYFLLQGMFFYYAVRLLDNIEKNGVVVKTQMKAWLMFGLSMFLMSTAKSSAIVVLPSVLLFFAIEKKWMAAIWSVVFYIAFKLPYELFVKLTWHADNQFKGQSKILLQKDPYDNSLGQEDIGGFVTRFFENCNLSLSKRFYQLIGWREEMATDVYGILAFITVAIALYGFWKLIQHKNKPILLMALFTGAQLVLSFIILQVRWDQARITLVGMPILLVLIFYAVYVFSVKKKWHAIYFTIVVLVVGSVLLSSFKRGFANIPIVTKNLKGDKYYGYTADWQNFLKCSEWCADSLKPNSLVASRKAPMSFVYGNGKKFFPVYSVVHRDTITKQSNPDSALAYFEKNKVTHIMVGSLRANPRDPGVGIINTIHFIVYPIMEKYPEKLRLVHTEGAYEETQVFEIIYR